ncbi:hypothetical protein M5D96_001479 [Drosophila gunungcola]|uniref:Uncharacterized protein n=1 Tax=Drosophila gunungcola TaxID=103775 RepID=A0A9P9YZ21_9MUSC|nr:hypothetical protein M5D96_001479 [Drosophila gunungcola]
MQSKIRLPWLSRCNRRGVKYKTIFRKSCHEINGSRIYTRISHRPTTASSMNNESSKAARKEKVTSLTHLYYSSIL